MLVLRSPRFVLLSATLFAVACGDDGGAADDDADSSESGAACEGDQIPCADMCIDPVEPTLANIQSTLFVTCAFANCHGSGPAEMLSMDDAATTHANLVGVTSVQRPSANRVEPGDPAASYLINKLRGEDIEPTASDGAPGQVMPIGAPFCDARIEAIEQWIRDGAQNN